jgi:cytochrome c-type biogenesis protein CcmF
MRQRTGGAGGVIAPLGFAGNALALVSAAALVWFGVRGARDPDGLDRRALGWAVAGIVAGAVVSFLALEWAILGDDFSLEYVAGHSARSTPLLFKVATLWAALEGSLVLWGLVLAVYVAVVHRTFRRADARDDGDDGDRLGAGALAVMGLVAVFFFGLLVSVANPFRVLADVPADGPGPNPLLQNHVLMAVHPPLLYAGYVGFTAPFAFAVSALALGRRGAGWVRRTQRWTLVAWTFLTAGIVGGAWWSYEVLGWGGYWAWDPVENASFLPWLVGTAYLHSAVIQARRGLLQAWSVALVLATFSLTIFGTFLTRSGVIASVHSFSESPIGPALLAFLGVVVVGSFGLFAWRAHLVAGAPRLESLASREGAFLVNNLLLALFAFSVLVGTTYPLLLEAFTGNQASVGRPFFDRIAIPLSLALLAAMGVGPLLPFRSARPSVVWERFRLPLRIGLAAAALAVVTGITAPYVVLVLLLGTTIVAAVVRSMAVAARKVGSVAEVARRDPGYWGGQLSHIGVVLLAIGIAVSGNLGDRAVVNLTPGDSADFGGYELTYDQPYAREEAGNRQVRGARVLLSRDGGQLATLTPELTSFPNATQPIGTPAVWMGRTGDEVYVTLSRIDTEGVTLTVSRHPLVALVWTGGFVAAGGGALSLLLRRRSRRRVVVPERALADA